MEQKKRPLTNQDLTSKPTKYIRITNFMEKVLFGFSSWVRCTMRWIGEQGNIKRKKALIKKVVLSKEQEKEIKHFFAKHYGKAISPKWHKLYQSYTGTYRYDYFPEILFSTRLELKLNSYRESAFLGDKNLLETLFAGVDGVRIPQTYVSCVRGFFRDANGNPLSREKATEIVADIGPCVVKKTVDTSSGRDVVLCNFQGGINQKDSMTVENVLSEFGKDFTVQEMIRQAPALSVLNRSSVNTFRVMTYLCNGDIYVCPLALRLGRSSADKDNIHYGGICVGVREDGMLRKQAFSEYGESFEEHPDSRVVFEGYEIPGVQKLGEAAKRLHTRLPHLGIISWDLTLDENKTPVLIEMNLERQSAWFPQMVNGEPLFGDNTAKMLELIRK